VAVSRRPPRCSDRSGEVSRRGTVLAEGQHTFATSPSACRTGGLTRRRLATLADDELVAALTEIPGIGPWTAQGALIIALSREDVVLPGDLALRKAVRTVYRLDHLPAEEEVLAIAEKWRPYRSLATRLLVLGALEEAQALACPCGAYRWTATRVER